MPEIRRSGKHPRGHPPGPCPQCGSRRLRRSKVRGLVEGWRRLASGSHPIRCHDCRHRFWTEPTRNLRPGKRLAWAGLAVLVAAAAAIWYFRTPAPGGPDASGGRPVKPDQPGLAQLSPEIAPWVQALGTVKPEDEAAPAATELGPKAAFIEPEGWRVPWDMLNQPLAYVEWQLAKLGIPYRVVMFGPTLDQPPQKVFRLLPAPGKVLPADGTLHIYAYQNPQFRHKRWWQRVHGVVGLPLDEAEALLRKQGLQTVLIPVPTAEPAMDQVVRSQSLRPGSQAWPTTQIQLQVNKLVAAAQPASPPEQKAGPPATPDEGAPKPKRKAGRNQG